MCTKIYRFVEYTPLSCFNSFVQSAVNARREGDKNPNSTVVAETMKLQANSSYGYQIIERTRHTVSKYLNDEKTHSAINNKMFKRPIHINNNLYEVEIAKAEVEHKQPIIVCFFILQYAKLRMLELCYNFFTSFVRMTSTRKWKWILIRSISPSLRQICIIALKKTRRRCGSFFVVSTAMTIL